MSRGFEQIFQQARKIFKEFQRLQEELSARTFEAYSGGGMVTCTVNGKGEVLSVKISDEVWNEQDRELIEDLVVAAVNEALKKSREAIREEMARIGLPSADFPFGQFLP